MTGTAARTPALAQTQQLRLSRDVQWLSKTYGEYKKPQIREEAEDDDHYSQLGIGEDDDHPPLSVSPPYAWHTSQREQISSVSKSATSNLEIPPALAQRETKLINRSKLCVYLVIVLSVAVLGTLTYLLMTSQEQQWYEDEFEEFSEVVFDSIHHKLLNLQEVTRTLASSWTAEPTHGADGTLLQASFNVTLPNFGLFASHLNCVAEDLATAALGRVDEEDSGIDNHERDVIRDESFLSAEVDTGQITPIDRCTEGSDDSRNLSVPLWQMFPTPKNASNSLIMRDLQCQIPPLLNEMLATRNSVFSPMLDFTRNNIVHILFTRHHEDSADENDGKFEQENHLNGRDQHFSLYFQPIFSSFNAAEADILGVVLAVIHWDDFLAGILESDAKELRSISTLLDELEDVPDDDHHALQAADDDSDNYESKKISIIHCDWFIRTSFDQTYVENWQSDDAVTFSIAVVGIFFFTAFIFLLYDCLVQWRNQRIMKTAQKSNAIVSSLFPKNVAAQMMEEANYESLTQSQATQKAFKSFNTSESSGPTSGTLMNGEKPIADLFSDTTILFADIAGFTAWSSMQDPGQVFILLETIFNAFDKIADRKKTVGDCYVAVCGLPDPSKDHAVIVASFARDCLTEMGRLTKQLEWDLGPDTSSLNMRIGLNSGPVTAEDGTSITDLTSDPSTSDFTSHHVDLSSLASPVISKNLKARKTALVRWHKEVLSVTLKKIIALRKRNLGGTSAIVNEAELSQAETIEVFGDASPGTCIDFPIIDDSVEGKDIQLDKVVEEQLGKYVMNIADTFTTQTPSTMLSMPLMWHFLSQNSLIHDADHPGVGNQQLVKEGHPLSKTYPTSIAERHSLKLSWQLLRQDCYHELRRTIYTTVAEFEHFRQLLVHSVLVTDIMDKELQHERKERWEKVFQNDSSKLSVVEQKNLMNLQKTAVLETVIQVSDVSHTMQHWKVYQKWNHRLFCELRKAFQEGRGGKDPSEFWYEGELGFYDFYIIPLAERLKECPAFHTSGRELLLYAMSNRKEWEIKGKEVVEKLNGCA
ncbi:adenylate/guanylate cyclase [Nitzschia inconspicua]|uniref:Adenylate/guanylate cyclase n=1 Tax=Nitzschia inconspicua TaxID=303405 RepID=A0A9K3KGL6_9STRA|nr:adenylate/guanylate cyclase [Nitzschia inconspicua]